MGALTPALIIANIMMAVGSILNASSSFFKSKRTILFIQATECCIGGVAQILANSLSAAAQLFICAIRNVVTGTEHKQKWIYWLFTGLFLVLGLLFNTRGIIGLLPIAATIQYTLWTGYCKTAQGIRYGMVVNYIPWIMHDFIVQMYTSAIVMLISLIITIINIIRNAKEKE